jgi:hypothetical protein
VVLVIGVMEKAAACSGFSTLHHAFLAAIEKPQLLQPPAPPCCSTST